MRDARATARAAVAAIATLALAGASLVSACGPSSLRRFPLAEPMWVDHDRRPFAPRPREWYSPYVWDGVDNSVMRPASEALALETWGESIDVNALDEVPDSSWYTNRLSLGPIAPEVLARGACEDVDPETPGVDDDVRGPFTITRGKPDGASPGFFVTDARGRRHLLKPDTEQQPERGSAADAIGAAVFWGAGYFVPCNRVVFVRRDELTLSPDAELRRTDGFERPMTAEDVEEIVAHATRLPDGRLRFGLSEYIEGEPISPWTYEGTWPDDPNDVVPHEDRRELRGMYVLASWLSHIDSRQENTMAAWMPAGGGAHGYVRHYVIDFSDTLGILFEWDALARRFGHSGYFDVQHIVEDFLTLGLLDRPWHHAELGPAGAMLGYFDVERYQPDRWRPGYPNQAFERMTERDAAWMARILARLSDAHLRALVERARFSDPRTSEELLRVLAGRRDRALERWLTRLSPLTGPVIDPGSGRVCAEDLSIVSGIRDPRTRRYRARGFVGRALEPHAVAIDASGDGRVCVEVPRARGASAARPSYAVIDVVAGTEGAETTGPLRLHLYDLGAEGVRIVGAERPEGEEPPAP